MLTEEVVTIVKKFQIPAGTINVTPITNGRINMTYKVTVTKPNGVIEYFVLQKINEKIFPDPVSIMENLQKLASFHPYPGLELTLTAEGDGWIIEADGLYRLMTYIDNVNPDQRANQTYFEAGKAVGTFHRQYWNYDSSTLYPAIKDFHHTPKRLVQFLKAVEFASATRVKDGQSEIHFIEEMQSLGDAIINKLERGVIPYRVTHNDTKLDNILFDLAGNSICLVDFDTVMAGTIAWDVGDAIRSMANLSTEEEQDLSKVGFDFKRFHSFMAGYSRSMDPFLSRDETLSLVDGCLVLTFEQGLRFLTDFLNHDQYYPVRYENQNLIRARVQLKLLADMLKVKPKMDRLIQELFPISCGC